MARQYLSCEFKPGGRRYTYHHDGEPCAPGDRVNVETRGGSIKPITVAEISPHAPLYETKPIVGLADLASAAAQPSEEK